MNAVICSQKASCRPELHDVLDLRVLLVAPDEVRRHRLPAREGEGFQASCDARWSAAEVHYFGTVMPVPVRPRPDIGVIVDPAVRPVRPVGDETSVLQFAVMPGDAHDTIKRFWEIQDGGDYSQLASLFADDAVLVDPVFGTFTGGEAIAGFMQRMNVEMAERGASFRLVELAGDDSTAWAQWEATTSAGPRTGVGVYRVRDGKLTYYRDYMNAG